MEIGLYNYYAKKEESMKRKGRTKEYEIEPGEICEFTTRSFTRQSRQAYHATAPHQAKHFTTSGSSRNKKKKAKITHKFSPEIIAPVTAPAPAPVLAHAPTTPSVSVCYIFKSRLQEYAQRAGFETPVYETTKEGPSHEPLFRSTVILNGVRYDSLPGFFNRKASEQSAAEVALLQLSCSADTKFGIALPVNETGLSKNLLQEYAQKMNYAVPLYDCSKLDSKKIMYSCTVDVGGTKYIGAPANTKKEAEIKAARVALLAIQSAGSDDPAGKSVNVVIPQKKKSSDLGINTPDTVACPKPKRGKKQRKKFFGKRGKKAAGELEAKMDGEQARVELVESGDVSVQQTNSGELSMETRIDDSNTGEVFDGDTEKCLDIKVLDQVDTLGVDMDGQKSGVTHNVSFQEKTTDVSKEFSSQGTDSEVGHMEIHENDLALSNEGLHKETLDIKADGGAAVESGETNVHEEASVTNDVILQGKDSVTDFVPSHEEVLKDELDMKMLDQESGFTATNNKGIDENASNNILICQGTHSEVEHMETNTENDSDKVGASTTKIAVVWHSSTSGSQNDIANAVVAGEAGLESGKATEELTVTNEGDSKEGLDVKMCDQESGLSENYLVMDMTESEGVQFDAADATILSEKENEDSEELNIANVISCE